MRTWNPPRALRAVVLSILALGACAGPPPADDAARTDPRAVEIETADELIVIEARDRTSEATRTDAPAPGNGGAAASATATAPPPAAPPVIAEGRGEGGGAGEDGRGADRGALVFDSLAGVPLDTRAPSAEMMSRAGAKGNSRSIARRRVRQALGGGGLFELPPGLQAKGAGGVDLGLFPLRRTVVDAEASGWLATTRLTQTFENRFDQVVEAVYVFPMVVGPRYVPGNTRLSPGEASDAGSVRGGGGTARDTDQVPDASRISPPVLPAGMRSGRDVAIKVVVDAGTEIVRIESPSHDVRVETDGPSRAYVALNPADAIPNKDFVLRWTVQTADVAPGFIAHRTDEHGGFFSAFLVPQMDPGDAEVTPREVTFVIDSSGSMNGVPIETCKALAEKTLRKLRPYDRFNIIRFAGSSGSLAETPIDVTPENIEKGVAYLQNLKGRGGTEMLAGIEHWLAQPRDARYLRIVVFLTDGYIGNEEAIHAIIRDKGQDARWFAFGIGSSVNRFLVEGIAEMGNGAAVVVLPREPEAALKAADRLLRRFDSPMLVDVTVDANGLPLADLYPKRMPDLFAGEPIKVTGRFTGPARGELIFRGRVGDREVAIPVAVDLPDVEEGNVALASVWARTRIKDFSRRMAGTEGEARRGLEQQIESLAVEFRLVSSETSFVAVDESRIVGDGHPLRILQPVEIPEGVTFETAVGPVPGTMGLRVAAWGVTFVETQGGALVVAVTDESGAAAAAGLPVGAVVTSVGGHAVRSAGHLEALLLQAAAGPLDVVFKGRDQATGSATLTRS